MGCGGGWLMQETAQGYARVRVGAGVRAGARMRRRGPVYIRGCPRRKVDPHKIPTAPGGGLPVPPALFRVRAIVACLAERAAVVQPVL